MLRNIRQSLTLLLLGLLPLHALLVTVLTKILAGSGHRPLTVLALWKEGILGAILLLAIVEIFAAISKRVEGSGLRAIRFDLIDGFIVAFIVLAFGITALRSELFSMQTFLGIKYDIVPLIAFIILRRVEWDEDFLTDLTRLILWIAAIVAGYGILTLLLPSWYFAWLGYSDLHSLYVPTGPIAAFQYIEQSALPRLQSTMSGPNQLGLWLLIPLSIIAASYVSSSKGQGRGFTKVQYPLFVLLVALLLTFSRAAWIAAVCIGCIALLTSVPRRARAGVVGSLILVGIVSVIAVIVLRPPIIVRSLSNADHLRRPLAALQSMKIHPLGLGLGSAGPASNAVSDVCVVTTDAAWAKDSPDLCVFVGGAQVQPTNRECHCPVLPENWFLQIGMETGVIGMLIYGILVIVLLWRLAAIARLPDRQGLQVAGGTELLATRYSLLAFLGVSVAGLFLHSFEDAAVSYTVWVMLALCYTPSTWKALLSSSISADSTRT